MTRLGKFVTPEELEGVKVNVETSGMFLSGGQPMGDLATEVERLRKQYGMPEGTGLDAENGEFVSP